MNLSTMSQRELRAEYMERRRKCKKLYKGVARLERELDQASKAVSEDNPAAAEYVAELLDLSKTGATTMQRLQLETWQARQACERRGVAVPAPHRSEGKGFRGADPEALADLRNRLEEEENANSAALIREGRA